MFDLRRDRAEVEYGSLDLGPGRAVGLASQAKLAWCGPAAEQQGHDSSLDLSYLLFMKISIDYNDLRHVL
jgi:hypothetical protein